MDIRQINFPLENPYIQIHMYVCGWIHTHTYIHNIHTYTKHTHTHTETMS